MNLTDQKILVVDDEPAICSLMRDALSRFGYEAIVVGSGAEALALASNSSFGLVFVDLNLPDMDGIDLYGALKAAQPAAVGYLMTGHASEEESQRCRQAGMAYCLVKPVRLSVLVDLVKAVVGPSGASVCSQNGPKARTIPAPSLWLLADRPLAS